jgi:hypothetical protein
VHKVGILGMAIGCGQFLRHDVNGLHVRGGDLVAGTVRHGAGTDGQHFPFEALVLDIK